MTCCIGYLSPPTADLVLDMGPEATVFIPGAIIRGFYSRPLSHFSQYQLGKVINTISDIRDRIILSLPYLRAFV